MFRQVNQLIETRNNGDRQDRLVRMTAIHEKFNHETHLLMIPPRCTPVLHPDSPFFSIS